MPRKTWAPLRGRFPVAPREERTIDGKTFASKGEAQRYAELKLMERAKVISRLEIQPSFDVHINGQKLCTYTADFSYLDAAGDLVIEDKKSSGTAKDPAYRLRKKAAELAHGIRVREV